MKFKVYFPTYDPVTLLRFSKIDIDRVHDTFLPISPEIQLRLSLSLFSLLVSLGEASHTRIETMAEKRYRGTGASWQGRTTTSRMLLYVGNTSFILRSISVSTLERKPPCPLFSLPSSPSLSLSLSLVSSCWTVCPHDRSISRVILGLVALSFDETTCLVEGKSWTWGLTRLKDFIRYDDIRNFSLSSILENEYNNLASI